MKIRSLANCFCLGNEFSKNEIYEFDEEFCKRLIVHDKDTFVLAEDKPVLADANVPNKSVKNFSKKG